RFDEERGETLEVPFEIRLVERDLRQLEEVVLEVVEIPENRLPIEGGSRVRHSIVDHSPTEDLEAWELGDYATVQRQHRSREVPALVLARGGERVEESGVAEILLQVHSRRLVDLEDLRHLEPRPAECAREAEECAILRLV